MYQLISKKMSKKRKGFTLIELIVVIAILGILAAIAIPRFTGVRETAAIGAAEADARTVLSAVGIYYAEKGEYPAKNADISALSDYLDDNLSGTVAFTDNAGNFTYTTTDATVTVTDGVVIGVGN